MHEVIFLNTFAETEQLLRTAMDAQKRRNNSTTVRAERTLKKDSLIARESPESLEIYIT
jgi:hypothetical protein